MNVAVVIGVYDPSGGGAERSTAQIVEQLAALGHRVTVITGYCPEHAAVAAGVGLECLWDRRPRMPWWLWRFSNWARRRLVDGGFDASLSVATSVPALVVQPRGGTVRETHERNIAIRVGLVGRLAKRVLLKTSIKQQVLLRLERRTLGDPMVKRFAAVSGYVSRQLQSHYGVEAERISLIPNAAVIPAVSEEQRRQWRRHVREGFGVTDDRPVYLFPALNPRLKGIAPLLLAAKRLADRGQVFALLLVGHVGYGHVAQIARLGIRASVRVVGPTDQMFPLYAAADVTVLPTFYDPASKVVIESLMMGTPAISTSFNGASDLIASDGGSPRGWVIEDPADVDALAEAMGEMADPEVRRRCIAAMNGLSESLSIERHARELELLFRGAAAEVG